MAAGTLHDALPGGVGRNDSGDEDRRPMEIPSQGVVERWLLERMVGLTGRAEPGNWLFDSQAPPPPYPPAADEADRTDLL
jgi:hypothetical protein